MKKTKEYWLITTSEQHSQSSSKLITTDVYNESPFQVFFDINQNGGIYDVHIIFAQQITKEQYDDYKKWEDSL